MKPPEGSARRYIAGASRGFCVLKMARKRHENAPIAPRKRSKNAPICVK